MYPRRYRSGVFGGLSGGLFLIFVALAFMSGHFILPMIFIALACAAFFGSMASGKADAGHGGLVGAAFFLGLAVLAWTNLWWPGMLIVLGICAILGSMRGPIMGSMTGFMGPMNQPQQYQTPQYQPPVPPQQPYQPYQEGYQPPPPTYQEGGSAHPYPQQEEGPQAQYPQQPYPERPMEMPPQ